MNAAQHARLVRAVTGWHVSRQLLKSRSPRKKGAITRGRGSRAFLQLVASSVRMDWRIARQARAVPYADPRRFWKPWRWMR